MLDQLDSTVKGLGKIKISGFYILQNMFGILAHKRSSVGLMGPKHAWNLSFAKADPEWVQIYRIVY